MMTLLSVFRSYLRVIRICAASVCLAILLTACPGKGKKTPEEEAWITLFRQELAKSQEQLFESRYIQNRKDPYYLKEILPRIYAHLEKSATPGPIPEDLLVQIDIRREDYEESWPVLSDQLIRMQGVFTISSVLAAHYANLAMASATSPYDFENAANISKFESMVKSHTLFNSKLNQLELAPEVRNEVMELAKAINVRTLNLISEALKAGPAANLAKTLARARDEIRVLSPGAAAAAGQPLSLSDEPFMEDPAKTWEELSTIYYKTFSLLKEFQDLGHAMHGLAQTSRPVERQALEKQFNALTGDIRLRVKEIKALQAHEEELVERLYFSTSEKQFKIADQLARGRK